MTLVIDVNFVCAPLPRFGDTPASENKDANVLVGDTGDDLFEKGQIFASVSR